MALAADQSRIPSPAVDQSPERRARQPAAPVPPRRGMGMVPGLPSATDAHGALWWARIPGRIWRLALGAVQVLLLLAAILDALVAATMLGLGVAAWAWWTERITDDQVAGVLGQLGARGLAILGKSGVL